jgi:hypothetical protein
VGGAGSMVEAGLTEPEGGSIDAAVAAAAGSIDAAVAAAAGSIAGKPHIGRSHAAGS